MKTLLRVLLLAAVAVFLLSNCALSANHSATPTWGPSSTAGATYNVWKANCLGTVSGTTCSQEGAFTLLVNVPNNQLSYVDTNVSAGASYVYYLTAYCDPVSLNCGSAAVGESVPSAHIAATIPKDQPGAPTSPTITVR